MLSPEVKPLVPIIRVFINLFISKLTKHGNKSLGFLVFYGFLTSLKQVYKCDPYLVLGKFFSNGALRFALVEYTTGGKKYQVPIVADPMKARHDFIGRFLKNALARTEASIVLKLLAEMEDFFAKKGVSYKEKMQFYSIARQNKMYAKTLYDAVGLKKKKVKIRNVTKN